jgi:hypothetical protein
LLTVTLACGWLAGCAEATDPKSPSGQTASRARVHELLRDGVWRLTSYIPDEQLSPAFLLSMQTDKILVRFDDGRIQSATASMTMDRGYRIASVDGNRFKILILDESGVEYESVCTFDRSGNLEFVTVTPPWRGRGLLQKEGPALDRPIPQ